MDYIYIYIVNHSLEFSSFSSKNASEKRVFLNDVVVDILLILFHTSRIQLFLGCKSSYLNCETEQRHATIDQKNVDSTKEREEGKDTFFEKFETNGFRGTLLLCV